MAKIAIKSEKLPHNSINFSIKLLSFVVKVFVHNAIRADYNLCRIVLYTVYNIESLVFSIDIKKETKKLRI